MKLFTTEADTTQGQGSYLVWKDGKTMLFRKPPAARRLEALLSVAVTVQLVVGPLVGAVLTGKTFWAALSALGAGWVLFFLYYVCGPDDIRLNGDQRTYERTVGWPWKPVTHTGTFGDIKGVCVTPRYNVLLLLKKPGWPRQGVVLGSSLRSSAANELAEEVSRTLGIPIVPCPRW